MQLTRRSVFSCVSGVPVLVLVVRRRSGFLHPTESPHEQGLVAVASSSDLVTLVSNNKIERERKKDLYSLRNVVHVS